VPGITSTVNGNKLSLSIGGVRAYNSENLYGKKTEEHFKVFVGFKNHVCINLCISTDGFLDDLRIMSVPELFNRVFQLLTRFDAERQINHLSTLSEYTLTEHQFAQLVGKSRLYQYLLQKTKKALDTVVPISDTQISTVGRDYYEDKSFCREESGNINLWKVYNLFTGATKSSYIDTFLDRNVGSLLFINNLADITGFYNILTKTTSEAFMSFADTLRVSIRYNIDGQHNLFLQNNSKHPRIGQNTFSRWLKLYAGYKNWDISHSHSNNVKYMEFTEKPTRIDRLATTQTNSEPIVNQEVVTSVTNS
jgi:hypothetical protein